MAPSARLDGKIVAVTGGGRGIGLAFATLLQTSGAELAIGDFDRSEVAQARGRLGLDLCCALDVTDHLSLADCANRTGAS